MAIMARSRGVFPGGLCPAGPRSLDFDDSSILQDNLLSSLGSILYQHQNYHDHFPGFAPLPKAKAAHRSTIPP